MNWIHYTLIAMVLQGAILFTVKLFSFQTNPLIVLLYQYVGSVIVLFFYILIKKISFKINFKELLWVFLSGFLVSTGLSFYYLAIGLGEASKVIPIHNVGITLFPALLGFFFLKEKVTKKTILGIICSIVCVILLTI